MKGLLKKLFGKSKVEEIKGAELISGVEYDRLDIAIAVLKAAWSQGLSDFQVTYKPIDNLGVDYCS